MPEMVPFLDLKAAYDELAPLAEPAMLKSFRSGWYILGPEVEAFEEAFATFCGADHAVGVANGLDALKLALRAAEIGVGDKVLVPSNTYIATWLAVSDCGAIPVPVEPDEATHNITSDGIRQSMQSGVKAVIAVHLYGQPVDIPSLYETARELDIVVIEDAAQAHGARFLGERVGALGDFVCWSFYPGKNLGALGDGGAVTTNNADVAAKLKLLRNYGSAVKYENEIIGSNSRLDPVQAAFLTVKLDKLDEWNARRARIAAQYLDAFKDTSLILPSILKGAESAWHLFVVRHQKRDMFAAKMAEAGVQTMVHYPIPPHAQKAYTSIAITNADLPVASRLANEVLSLPIGPHLSEAQVLKAIKAVLDADAVLAG